MSLWEDYLRTLEGQVLDAGEIGEICFQVRHAIESIETQARQDKNELEDALAREKSRVDHEQVSLRGQRIALQTEQAEYKSSRKRFDEAAKQFSLDGVTEVLNKAQ